MVRYWKKLRGFKADLIHLISPWEAPPTCFRASLRSVASEVIHKHLNQLLARVPEVLQIANIHLLLQLSVSISFISPFRKSNLLFSDQHPLQHLRYFNKFTVDISFLAFKTLTEQNWLFHPQVIDQLSHGFSFSTDTSKPTAAPRVAHESSVFVQL